MVKRRLPGLGPPIKKHTYQCTLTVARACGHTWHKQFTNFEITYCSLTHWTNTNKDWYKMCLMERLLDGECCRSFSHSPLANQDERYTCYVKENNHINRRLFSVACGISQWCVYQANANEVRGACGANNFSMINNWLAHAWSWCSIISCKSSEKENRRSGLQEK